ncbi:MAG: aldolase catalytic domain-containing protein [Verrucomicrobiae bacterium]|nr:aldolase catalytic domain-containing protein [Verrucomicrobiae bacterium]
MTIENQQLRGSKGWVTYRPELKVLDCTIRDGGLMNNHHFDEKLIHAVYEACDEAGVDYMEAGYKASKKIFSPEKFGAWKFCEEDDLRRMAGDKQRAVRISVMADAGRTNYHTDILPREKSAISLIRVAAYANQIPAAIDLIKDAHDKGYETTVNLMAISAIKDWELDEALESLASSPVGALYLVDSFGSLYSEQIAFLTQKYLKVARAAGKEVGIHTHDNLQLAYANTIEAIIQGANWADASMAGLGRGSGNCRMELLLSFLHNPKFRLRPVLSCVQEHVEPMREKLRWGFGIPYLVTGHLNLHPRAAMEFMEGANNRDIVKFYDATMEEE